MKSPRFRIPKCLKMATQHNVPFPPRRSLHGIFFMAALALVSACQSSEQPPSAATEATTEAAIMAQFEALSRIPRCSKHEATVSQYLVDWAKTRGIEVKTDDAANVVITVPATSGYENNAAITLQAHMDMVCQKTSSSTHDFSKDPITLVRNGDYLTADQTTLGADDGIGVALALTLAEDNTVEHPKLEFLFTTDEEIDMSGAAALKAGFITGKYYLNVDSENEGVVTIGSAGGMQYDIALPLHFESIPAGYGAYTVKVDGLVGGHSGMEIGRGGANANKLLAKALDLTIPFRIASFTGGTAANAITKTSEASVVMDPSRYGEFQQAIASALVAFQTEYGAKESGLSLAVEAAQAPPLAVPEDETKKVLQLVNALPFGVIDWSPSLPGQVETSSNVGIVATKTDSLYVRTYNRSALQARLADTAAEIVAAASSVGATATLASSYSPWEPDPTSTLLATLLANYKGLYGTDMTVEVVHAGLECSQIASKFPGVQIVSIGPTLTGVHTPEERLNVPSTLKVYALLANIVPSLGN